MILVPNEPFGLFRSVPRAWHWWRRRSAPVLCCQVTYLFLSVCCLSPASCPSPFRHFHDRTGVTNIISRCGLCRRERGAVSVKTRHEVRSLLRVVVPALPFKKDAMN